MEPMVDWLHHDMANAMGDVCNGGMVRSANGAPRPDVRNSTAPRYNTSPTRCLIVSVSATRVELPLAKFPFSIQSVDRNQISRARPTWGLDEALVTVPGVFVANRYNFSQDQRISIRGFGARSAFAVRGIKILVDGIPQTVPDGQGSANESRARGSRPDRGTARISVGAVRNSSGGVISILDAAASDRERHPGRALRGGQLWRTVGRTWNKWRSTTAIVSATAAAQMTCRAFG